MNYNSVRNRIFIGKIFYNAIWDNGLLVREFIPSRRNSDWVVGMYDSANNTFYTNMGTDNFIAGPVVNNCDAPIVRSWLLLLCRIT